MKGKRIGIDATTLEANAALRSMVRRDNGESYEEFLRGLARESGVETPTREALAQLHGTHYSPTVLPNVPFKIFLPESKLTPHSIAKDRGSDPLFGLNT